MYERDVYLVYEDFVFRTSQVLGRHTTIWVTTQAFLLYLFFQIGSHTFILVIASTCDIATYTSGIIGMTGINNHAWLVLWTSVSLFCLSRLLNHSPNISTLISLDHRQRHTMGIFFIFYFGAKLPTHIPFYFSCILCAGKGFIVFIESEAKVLS
jgi:hypothetical protein